MNESDELPPSICSICLKKLLSFNNFRKQATSNAYKLMTILNDYKEQSLLREISERVDNIDADADECIIEYIDESIDLEIDPLEVPDDCDTENAQEISLHDDVVDEDCTDEIEIDEEIQMIDEQECDGDANDTVTDDYEYEEDLCTSGIESTVAQRTRPNRSSDRHKCQVCGKWVVNLKPHMEIHMESGSRRKPYQCKYCGKEFLQRAQFDSHVNKEHTGLKPFECDQCGKSFHGRPSLRMHKIQHSGERRFKCEFCPNRYMYAHHLSYHRHTHTKERTFPCEQCDYTSVHMEHLRRHILSKHTEAEDKPYKCDVCSRSFNGRSNLKRHVNRVHSQEPKPIVYTL